MKTLVTIAALLVAILLFGATCIAIWYVVWATFGLVRQLDEHTSAILICAALIAFSCCLLVCWSQRAAKKLENRSGSYERKADAYWALLEAWLLVREELNSLEPNSESNIQVDLSQIETQVVLWAGADVIEKYAAFRAARPEQNPNGWLLLGDVVAAMRKDLGESMFGVTREELVQLLERREGIQQQAPSEDDLLPMRAYHKNGQREQGTASALPT